MTKNDDKFTEFVFSSGDIESGIKGIEGTIKGYSNMPFWNHDLKLRAVIALLGMVDYKQFFEADRYDELNNYLDEIEEIVKALRGM